MYTYNLPAIPVSEFDTMRRYVEDAYREHVNTKIRTNMELVQVTSNIEEIEQHKRGSRISDSIVGYAWRDGSIWIRPGRSYQDTCRTAMHELAHVRVTNQAHGVTWRRVFLTAWGRWLLDHGYSESEVRCEVRKCLDQYRQWRRYTPQGNFNPYAAYQAKKNVEANTIYKTINPWIKVQDPNRVRWIG